MIYKYKWSPRSDGQILSSKAFTTEDQLLPHHLRVLFVEGKGRSCRQTLKDLNSLNTSYTYSYGFI